MKKYVDLNVKVSSNKVFFDVPPDVSPQEAVKAMLAATQSGHHCTGPPSRGRAFPPPYHSPWPCYTTRSYLLPADTASLTPSVYYQK